MTRLHRFSIDHLYVVVAVGAAFVAAYGLWGALHNPPPLQYSDRHYVAAKPVYAPGETLTYSPTLRFRDWGPAEFTRTFWNRTTDGAAKLCDGTDAPVRVFIRNLPFETVGEYREGNAREVVPNLPPGDYWLIGSVKRDKASQYQVAFRVEQPC